MPYTVNDLIANVKRRTSMPTTQNLFSNDSFASLATDELLSYVVPLIVAVQEEYFVGYQDFTIDPNTNSYQIPWDAVGNALRSVVIVNDANEVNLAISSLPRLDLEKIAHGTTGPLQGIVGLYGYYVQGNKIKLFPAQQGQNGRLRIYYTKRCHELIPNVSCLKVREIDTVNKVVTGYTTVPGGITAGVLVDAVEEASTFETHASGLTVLDVPTTTTVALSSVDGIVVDDWIGLQGQSCVVQLPVEAQAVLAQAVAVKCLEALGDEAGMQRAQSKLTELIQHMQLVMSPRISGQPKKITNAGTGIFSALTGTSYPRAIR